MKDCLRRKSCFTLCLLILLGLALSACQADADRTDLPDSKRSQFMLRGMIFYSSAHPPDAFDDEAFQQVGTIQSELGDNDTFSADYQAYGIAIGAKIYQNPDIPQQAYVVSSGFAPYRYCTLEASRQYVFYNETLYVSLSSMDYVAYRNKYSSTYESTLIRVLPEDAIRIGETQFIGYDTFPRDQLSTNVFPEPCELFYTAGDCSALYLRHPQDTSSYMILVPYPEPKEVNTG